MAIHWCHSGEEMDRLCCVDLDRETESIIPSSREGSNRKAG